MTAYTLMVLSKPVEGKENEYNDWYTNTHLGDVLRLPGMVSARRFKVSPGQESSHEYLALYNVETDDVSAILTELTKRARTPEMSISPALGDAQMTIFEAITPVHTA